MNQRRSGGKDEPPAASAAHDLWRDALMFDTGDTFSDLNELMGDRLADLTATAGFLVDQFNAEGLSAQTLGDRDLALGRATLEALAQRAHYPIVTTNLVDADSGKPLFKPFVVLEEKRGEKRIKIAVFGLMTDRASARLASDKLRIVQPLDAMKPALEGAKAQGAEVFVVLSQLMQKDEVALAEALPELQLFLGGDAGSMTPEPQASGKALSFAGSQKGKHLAFMTIKLDDPAGAGAPLIDPKRKEKLQKRAADAQKRVDNYQHLIDEATKPPMPPDGKPPARVPVEVYQRQLAAARADLQLATDELAAAGDAPQAGGINAVTLELSPLTKDIVEEPTVKSQVEEHRKKWPDPTPEGH